MKKGEKIFLSGLLIFLVLIVGILAAWALRAHLNDVEIKRAAATNCTQLKLAARPQNVALAEKADKLVKRLYTDIVMKGDALIEDMSSYRTKHAEAQQNCRYYTKSACSELAAMSVIQLRYLSKECQRRGAKHCPSDWTRLWGKIRQISCN